MRKERPSKASEWSDFLATEYAEYVDITLIIVDFQFKVSVKSAYSA
jgi:hypothetical protein